MNKMSKGNKILIVVGVLLIMGIIGSFMPDNDADYGPNPISTSSSVDEDINAVPPTFEVKYVEGSDNYTYWDKKGENYVEGPFRFLHVLVKGTPTKKACLEYIREVEKEQGNIETRIEFYIAYDETKDSQDKKNIFTDITIRNGDIYHLDESTNRINYMSDEEFLNS